MKVKAKSVVHDHIFSESDNQSLSIGIIYHVIEIDNEFFRVVDDHGEPVLYQKELFDIVDKNIPSNWVRVDYEDGEYHITPPELSARYFFEDYFDGKLEIVKLFENYKKLYGLL